MIKKTSTELGEWKTDASTLHYYYRFFVASGRTSASKGIPGNCYQSIFYLTHPTQPTGQTTTLGNSPISSRTVCGFFNALRREIMNIEGLWDGACGFESLSEKTWKFSHL